MQNIDWRCAKIAKRINYHWQTSFATIPVLLFKKISKSFKSHFQEFDFLEEEDIYMPVKCESRCGSKTQKVKRGGNLS